MRSVSAPAWYTVSVSPRRNHSSSRRAAGHSASGAAELLKLMGEHWDRGVAPKAYREPKSKKKKHTDPDKAGAEPPSRARKYVTSAGQDTQRLTRWMTEAEIKEEWPPDLFATITCEAAVSVFINSNGDATMHYLVVTGVRPYVIGEQWQ